MTDIAVPAPPRRPLHAAAGAIGAAVAVGAFGAAVWLGATRGEAALTLFLATTALVAVGVVWVELRLRSAKELAVVGTLGGLAAASRVLFHPLPDVMPMTALVVACGAALGPGAGATIGATGALVSNFVLGQGPWTPWQMLGWGLCGAGGGLLRPLVRRRWGFAAAGAVLALGFGAIQNLQFALLQLEQPGTQLGAALATAYGAAISFDVAHALTTAAVALAVGPELVRMLDRFARKLRTEVVWE